MPMSLCLTLSYISLTISNNKKRVLIKYRRRRENFTSHFESFYFYLVFLGASADCSYVSIPKWLASLSSSSSSFSSFYYFFCFLLLILLLHLFCLSTLRFNSSLSCSEKILVSKLVGPSTNEEKPLHIYKKMDSSLQPWWLTSKEITYQI